jgi:enediyne biosynthesis protein E4
MMTVCACMGRAQQVKDKPPADYTPKLLDITASTRIHFEHLSSPEQRYIVESMSGGVVLFDYDGDGSFWSWNCQKRRHT